jgi:hypothetical protein
MGEEEEARTAKSFVHRAAASVHRMLGIHFTVLALRE